MAEVKGISVYREETNPGTPAADSFYLVKAAGEAFAKFLATNNDGTITAALVGTRPRGAYDAGTAYTLGDEVTYEGSTWLCLQSTTGNAPPSLPTTSNSYWTLRASKGDTGSSGGFNYSGSGAPDNGDGSNGETYLDLDNGNTYLKSGGAWSLTGSIKGDAGADGADGSNGSDGADGADGNSAGLYFAFSTTTTMADPGAGLLRFNNATPASVTAIAIDDTTADTGNPDVSADITSWADSTATIKGRLIIREVGSPENFHIFTISGLTDNAGWTELAVAHVAGSGAFADTDNISVEFFRTGNNGADGAGSGDVTAASNFGTDNVVVRSDGTTKGVQATGISIDDSDNVSGIGNLSLSGTVDGRDVAADGTKLDYITVTQAVDLDQMETDIAALANGMVYKGDWDASTGSFPGGGSAQTGWFYNVSVGGTVDSVEFAAGDAIIATTDNASDSTYAANWTKKDATDAVTSVVGQVGSVTAQQITTAIDADATAENTLRDAIPASTTAKGTVELATTAEIDTGTDANRVITPDALAASDFGISYVQITAFEYTTDTATGDGAAYFHVPAGLDGMNLVEVHAVVITAGTTGTTDIQIANVTQAADMLSTKLTIDSGETGSDTAATAAVIDTSNDDVAENDLLRIDVDAVSTTAAKGLIVTMGFRKP